MRYIQAKPVYYDTIAKIKSQTRITDEQICFDSTSEFKLYLLLSRCLDDCFFKIDVHPNVSIGSLGWNIDFKITVVNNEYQARRFLASLVNTINGTSYSFLDSVYIEYKGHQDDNFIKKMSNVVVNAPVFAKTIILIGGDTSAFGCYDADKRKFYCQPMASMPIFQAIIQEIQARTLYKNGTK